MKIKWLFLFVLLAMPVGVYLFLQSFGENQFAIPVYYENGLEIQNQSCQSADQKPFRAKPLSDYDASFGAILEQDKVVIYGMNLSMNQSKLRNNLMSILNKYQSESRLTLLLAHSDSLVGEDLSVEFTFLNHAVVKRQLIEKYAQCELQIKLDTVNSLDFENIDQLVLCDQQRRIRGYYDATQLEEMDRLNTELDILLNRENEKK